jgi:hypothetical protein
LSWVAALLSGTFDTGLDGSLVGLGVVGTGGPVGLFEGGEVGLAVVGAAVGSLVSPPTQFAPASHASTQ